MAFSQGEYQAPHLTTSFEVIGARTLFFNLLARYDPEAVNKLSAKSLAQCCALDAFLKSRADTFAADADLREIVIALAKLDSSDHEAVWHTAYFWLRQVHIRALLAVSTTHPDASKNNGGRPLNYPQLIYPQLDTLGQGLRSWLTEYNLIEKEGVERWCRETAILSLFSWSRHTNNPHRPGFKPERFVTRYESYRPVAKPSPPQDVPEWDIELVPRDRYLVIATDSLRAALKSHPTFGKSAPSRREALIDSAVKNVVHPYCDQVEARAKAEKWTKIQNFKRNSPPQGGDIAWAVKYNSLRATYGDIAKEECKAGRKPLDETNFSRRVRKAIDFLGLVKRPDSGPGRKRRK